MRSIRVKIPEVELAYGDTEITEDSAIRLANYPAIAVKEGDSVTAAVYMREFHLTQDDANTLAELFEQTPEAVYAVFCRYDYENNLYTTLFRALVVYEAGGKFYALLVEP